MAKTPKRAYRAATAAVDTLKRTLISLYEDFSEQACKAGFYSLLEFMRVYEAFDDDSEYDIK
jgi:hypothetical protein